MTRPTPCTPASSSPVRCGPNAAKSSSTTAAGSTGNATATTSPAALPALPTPWQTSSHPTAASPLAIAWRFSAPLVYGPSHTDTHERQTQTATTKVAMGERPAALAQRDDVGDDAGDVVGAAGRVRRLDQPLDRLVGIAAITQRVPDGLRGDHGAQPVGAQQVPVAGQRVVQ